MNLSVHLGDKWYGRDYTKDRWGEYTRDYDPSAVIQKYEVRVRRVNYGKGYIRVTLSLENKEEGAWHQGGYLEIPLSVAKRLGAVLVGSAYAVKRVKGRKKAFVSVQSFRVREGRKMRIRA